MLHEIRTGSGNDRPRESGWPAMLQGDEMADCSRACGVRVGPAMSRAVRWMSCAAGLFLTVCPHLALASGWSDNDPAQVLLANVTPLTADQMAHESAGALPMIVPLPSPESNQPKIHLWDELVPSAVSTLQNGSSGVSIHFGP
jgi:hypothetical protein